MATQFTDFTNANRHQEQYQGIAELLPNVLKGYQTAKAPEQMQADLDLKRAQTAHALAQTEGRTFAPTNLGKLIQERDAIAAKNPNDPLIAQYDKAIKGMGSGRQYAPSGLGKLYGELEQIQQGYLPGSNGSVELDPNEQQELIDRYNLQIQKHTTDSATRTTVLRGQNLLKSMTASNIDALVSYSGLEGGFNLKREQLNDAVGKPSEKYLQYLEAKQAVELEAKELRQFFGDSITPQTAEAIYKMTNATSLTRSPEAAKRMIQKSRDTIEKQIKTFSGALKSTEPYQFNNKDTQRNKLVQSLANQGQPQKLFGNLQLEDDGSQ